jgi:hypothetical protein
MRQESCRNNIYANGLVQVQTDRRLKKLYRLGAIGSAQPSESTSFSIVVRLLGSIKSAATTDIVTGVGQGRRPGFLESPHNYGFPPAGPREKWNFDASDFCFFSKRFAGV